LFKTDKSGMLDSGGICYLHLPPEHIVIIQ